MILLMTTLAVLVQTDLPLQRVNCSSSHYRRVQDCSLGPNATLVSALDLSRNPSLRLDIAWFSPLTQLLALRLDDCLIRRLPEDVLTPLTSLRRLSVARNRIDHLQYAGFRGNRNLATLDAAYNRLRYLTDSTFTGLENLVTLNLSDNRSVTPDIVYYMYTH